MYLAFVLDMAVLFCFFDDQLTNLSTNSCILPNVLFLVSWQPAWSASAKAVRAMQESFEYHIPYLWKCMTRSSTKELFTPFKDPEREFRSSRKLFNPLKLRDNTFSRSDNEDVNKHIEKVLKIVNLFHIPNITQDQVMLQVFPISLTGDVSLWLRNKPSGLIKTWEDLKVKFLSKYCPPAQAAKKMEEINNF
ncbi:hypothetical protein Tco_1345580 [Tanacetum coccineum]